MKSLLLVNHGIPMTMVLTASEVSDYKGEAVLLDEIPQTKLLLADLGLMLTGWGSLFYQRVLRHAYLQSEAAKNKSLTSTVFTQNAILLKTCLPGSKTAKEPQHDMTAVLTLSFPLFALLSVSFFSLIKES